ncbi:MAG: ATP-binding protein, partial [Kiloniellales bacterium]|nr:ATP-binding protein [Kiloniellales bacterium]
DPNLWPCKVDPGQLDKTIFSLASNACDAMSGQGVFRISVENVEINRRFSAYNEFQLGSYVRISVRDTGCGMSEDVAARAFDPFFTTKTQKRCTGLGLSMAEGFIKQSGGHLAIDSKLKEGTTVYLYLPASNESGSGQTVSSKGGRTLESKGETILVCEDNEDLRILLVKQIMALGYEILEAANGLEVLSLLDGGAEVDLLLSDIMLPGGLLGRELAIEVGKRRPEIPVIFMSGGFSDSSISERSHLDEDAILLQKPFRLAELARTIRETLERNSD